MLRWILGMSCGSNAGIRLRHWLMPSSITLCSTPTYASAVRFCRKSSTSCAFSGGLAAQYFEINVLRSGLFSGQNLEVHTSLLHYCIFLGWEQRMIHRMSGQTQLAEKITTSRIWHRSVYNQTASDAWRYNKPVSKLMTDKLQLMLINVLCDQFLNCKVSQSNVATRLRCDGIFNDRFITQSLLSPRVEIFFKSITICRSYGQLSTGLFFYETRCSIRSACNYTWCVTAQWTYL